MKIAIIGGAGVRTVNFINGLLERQDAPEVDEVALYDIDRPKLEIIEQLAKHTVRRQNAKLRVYAVQDAKDALLDAQAVVTTLRVGGDQSRAADEQIALNRGVIGQETTGAGGFFMAARTIRPLMQYMEQAQKYAPHAYVFNFTNPSGLITQTLHQAGFTGTLGICDAPSSVVARMAGALGVEKRRLDVSFAGLNHLSWIWSVKLDGREMLEQWLSDRTLLSGVPEFSIFDPDSFLLSGCLPNEYLYYYYHRERALSNIQASAEPRGRMIQRINEEMFQALRCMDIGADPEDALQTFLYYIWKRELSYMSAETGKQVRLPQKGKLEIPSGMGYAGVMLDCLSALASEKAAHVVLNVPNQGTIACLQDGDIAELSCEVAQGKITPLPIKPLNGHCSNLMRTVKAYERTAAEALLSCSRKKAVEALALHPLVMSCSLSKALIADCIAAYPDSVCLQ